MCKYGGSGAEALKTAIDDLFMNQIQMQNYNSKVVSMTLNSATANAVTKIGLLIRMKNDDRPWLTPEHCLNHKIKLVVM